MILERIPSEGLAQYSYVVGDETAGVAAVIDPRRDVAVYLDLAREHQVKSLIFWRRTSTPTSSPAAAS
jgi:hydroxyacylglutathione hydrolase